MGMSANPFRVFGIQQKRKKEKSEFDFMTPKIIPDMTTWRG